MKNGILYLIDKLSLGGTEKQLVQLIQNIDRQRYQPHVCTLYKSTLDILDGDVPNFSLDFVSFNHLTIMGVITKLVSYIRRNRIRIVQSFFQDPTMIAALSSPFHKAHLVGSFRDLGFWRNRKETLKMRLAYRAYSGFIANSMAVKTHFVNTDGIDPAMVEVIYNGTDKVERGKCKRPPMRDGAPLVGIVANLNRPVKRVEDFVKMAARVHHIIPEVRFAVIGDGWLKPQLEELGRSLGLNEILTFTGLVNDPIKIIEGFRVGVITSETEGFCNAILEYMACGVPVVATAAGGNLELVREAENGFLVPVGDIEALAQRTVDLLKQDDMCYRIGRSNLQLVDEEYSVTKMVARHQNYYDRLLQEVITQARVLDSPSGQRPDRNLRNTRSSFYGRSQ